MKNIMTTVFDAVFSFAGLMAVLLITFAYFLIIGIAQQDAQTRACYNSGMIKVQTNAGAYCVAPTNLVEIK